MQKPRCTDVVGIRTKNPEDKTPCGQNPLNKKPCGQKTLRTKHPEDKTS